MPQILADEHRRAPEARIEGADPIAAREVALLVEHAVGRQVDLAMNGDDLSAVEEDRRIVEAERRRFLDEPRDERDDAAELAEARDLRRIERERDRRHHVAQQVSGEAELRENQEVGPVL